MIQTIWFGMMAGSVFYACLTGNAAQMMSAAMQGTQRSVTLTMELCAGYLLFCGLMEIAKALHIPGGLGRMMKPVFRLLLPGAGKASEAAAVNLSMNMLGLGNAATPAGMDAIRQLELERKRNPLVQHDMYMLLILNATGVQLFPTTMLAIRTSADSANPGAILFPVLAATAVSTFVGALAGIGCRKWGIVHGS